MTQNKTVETTDSPRAFIDSLDDLQKRKDCRVLMKIMREITGDPAKMWGTSIVGFGNYHYKYASGREGDFFLTGFSPRKRNLTIYIMPGFAQFANELEKIGNPKTSVSCLYLKNLREVDLKVLRRIIARSIEIMRDLYPSPQECKEER